MKKLLKKLKAAAARRAQTAFKRLGYVPNSDLEGLRLAYNDELQERLILKRDHKNLYEKYLKALEARPPLPGYTIRPYVAEARARKLEDALLLEFAPDEYFKTGLRESLMRAIDEQITYSKQETPDAVIWGARLYVAVTTSGSGDGHAEPVGAPGTEGPLGAGPLNPLYKNDISNL